MEISKSQGTNAIANQALPVNPKNWEKHIMIQNGILSISLRFSFKMGKQDMSI
jgi:hypothetical protein